jgi:hypothetical protein
VAAFNARDRPADLRRAVAIEQRVQGLEAGGDPHLDRRDVATALARVFRQSATIVGSRNLPGIGERLDPHAPAIEWPATPPAPRRAHAHRFLADGDVRS